MGLYMKRICTICARGGSKGVKNKNIRFINGIPLIRYTILQAQKTELFDVIAVSSDDKDILDVARDSGIKYLVKRPDSLAKDASAKVPAIRHCVETVEKESGISFDTFVDLDATSPLRIEQDILDSVAILEKENRSNLITAAPARRSPYFNLIEVGENGVVEVSKALDRAIVRRQDAPKSYDMNASIYIWQRRALFEGPSIFREDTALYVMPEERSIDIDSELDFKIVEMLLKERVN
jgi:CMP-N,N'-diacetyllegionaminic acid synthase